MAGSADPDGEYRRAGRPAELGLQDRHLAGGFVLPAAVAGDGEHGDDHRPRERPPHRRPGHRDRVAGDTPVAGRGGAGGANIPGTCVPPIMDAGRGEPVADPLPGAVGPVRRAAVECQRRECDRPGARCGVVGGWARDAAGGACVPVGVGARRHHRHGAGRSRRSWRCKHPRRGRFPRRGRRCR